MSEVTERFASQAWELAEDHLTEAEAQDAQKTPHALAHLAYYAMFHAARAVLLRVNKAAPKKHASVLGQFGLATKDRGDEFRRAGEDLKKTQTRRIDADYRDNKRIAPAEAEDSLLRARAFLDLCAERFQFERKVSSREHG